jgi:hypothetical protein
LKPSRNIASFALLLFIYEIGTFVPALQAQKPQNPGNSQAQKIAPVPSRVWKSETTGNEYRVWTENNRFHAEWLNIPPGSAAKGVYIRTVCHRAGQKWIGEARSYLPCVAGEAKKEQIVNFCHVTTGFEIDSMTDSRISGRTEGMKRFDCTKCQVLEKEWKSFVWVPKPQKSGPSRPLPGSQ